MRVKSFLKLAAPLVATFALAGCAMMNPAAKAPNQFTANDPDLNNQKFLDMNLKQSQEERAQAYHELLEGMYEYHNGEIQDFNTNSTGLLLLPEGYVRLCEDSQKALLELGEAAKDLPVEDKLRRATAITAKDVLKTKDGLSFCKREIAIDDALFQNNRGLISLAGHFLERTYDFMDKRETSDGLSPREQEECIDTVRLFKKVAAAMNEKGLPTDLAFPVNLLQEIRSPEAFCAPALK